ncbi:MAG: SUMF1/EgtB/PvdO family nonheme iron enzyme [Phycisphaerales bacterium]|jgi:formylglycine-generating enzyme required for sulfatase activity|nr:SUMF1/EgtB/PvdO family nonheme iron enzyme [Phycisphaerales bacterium]
MEKQYWVKREDKIHGPYSGSKLKKLAGEGKIGPGDLISTDKRAWLLAEMVRGLSLRTTVKSQQTGVTAPPPLEVSPRTKTASRAYRQQTPSTEDAQQLQSRLSRTKWVVIGVAGIAVIGLAVAVAIWWRTPPGTPTASKEPVQSNENVQNAVPSPQKPSGTRTTPAPTTPKVAAKPLDRRKSSPPAAIPASMKKMPKEKKAIEKKPIITVEQFKAASADFRTYTRSMEWLENETISRTLALLLMYGRSDKYEQAEAHGQASVRSLFEHTATSRKALRGRCFYLDVSSKSDYPVFVHDWSRGKATVTVTAPFEARGGGGGLSTFAFHQYEDPLGDLYSSSGFGVLLKNGKLQTNNRRIFRGQLVNPPICSSEAMALAKKGFVIYAEKQPYTYIKLPRVDISAEQADRYSIKKGGGLLARIYFTGLYYAGPMGVDPRLARKIKYFHLNRVRQRGSAQMENAAKWGMGGGTAQQPNVFVTTLPDPTDYVRADVVAIEVRTPEGALLAKVDIGTKACSNLTPASVAKQTAAVARNAATGGASERASTETKASPRRELVLDIGKSVAIKLVSIPAGKFVMGSSNREAGHKRDESPRHTVMISKTFYMGITEVTQEQYERVMGKNPSKFKGPQNPVECVSWNNATAFCRALSKKTGRTVRLPTEAQWEYACRAGTTTRFSFGDNDRELSAYGWCSANSAGETHQVGQKKPNKWGLYDMHGNVWEWCLDYYEWNFYARRRNVNPENIIAAKYHILRGGSRISTPINCRAALRNKYPPGSRNNNLGFRVVVTSGPGVN